MDFKKYQKHRLKKVEPHSLLPLDEFKSWVESEMEKVPYKNQSKSMRSYSKKKFYIARDLDRKFVRRTQDPPTEGEGIKMSHDAILYPDSQVLVRHGFKLWVHDLHLSDFICFSEEEIKMMMNCLRKGKWAVEKYEE